MTQHGAYYVARRRDRTCAHNGDSALFRQRCPAQPPSPFGLVVLRLPYQAAQQRGMLVLGRAGTPDELRATGWAPVTMAASMRRYVQRTMFALLLRPLRFVSRLRGAMISVSSLLKERSP